VSTLLKRSSAILPWPQTVDGHVANARMATCNAPVRRFVSMRDCLELMRPHSETSCSRTALSRSCLPISARHRISTVLRSLHTCGVVYAGRIRTSSLRERLLRGASSGEHRRQTVIPLVTPRLVIDPVRLFVLLGIFLLDGPRFRPCLRIVHRDGVLERVRTGARPTFGQMQVLARSHEIRLGTEIGDVDDQRLAFPAAPRVPKP